MFKPLVCTALLAVGACANPVLREEGPPCPIDDPLTSDETQNFNGTFLLPAFELFAQGTRGPLVAHGLSGLHYEYTISMTTMTLTLALTLPSVNLETSYTNIAGTIGLAPVIPQECLLSGAFAGAGDDTSVTASGLSFSVRAVLYVHLITNKVSIRELNIDSLDVGALNINFGTLKIDNRPVDWDTINSRLPTCILDAFYADRFAFTELVRTSANGWLGAYPFPEFDWLFPIPGFTCAPRMKIFELVTPRL